MKDVVGITQVFQHEKQFKLADYCPENDKVSFWPVWAWGVYRREYADSVESEVVPLIMTDAIEPVTYHDRYLGIVEDDYTEEQLRVDFAEAIAAKKEEHERRNKPIATGDR